MAIEFEGISKQLSSRVSDQKKSFFKKDIGKDSTLFLLSPSDIGVMRNGGKSGARFAPQALLNCFSKMIHQNTQTTKNFAKRVVSSQNSESQNFIEAQKKSLDGINEILLKELGACRNIIHIGGGHDHIYPFTMGIIQNLKLFGKKKIHIINIDAHLDTRTDHQFHSGTPFRQIFNDEENCAIELTQIGIHQYANAPSNYEGLEMKIIEMAQLSTLSHQELLNLLEKEIPYQNDTLYLLSVDCDGLDSTCMSAVSANNHFGLDKGQFQTIVNYYKDKLSQGSCIAGFYEFNPIFDDLGQSSARFLAHILDQLS
ncbi:MAG: hypothetical protein GY909_08175 [Oligoflexia bacterium]|nr:hypothetical protein [Oligoflexia bacterium]